MQHQEEGPSSTPSTDKLDIIPEERSSVATPPPNADSEKGEEPGMVEPQEEQESGELLVIIVSMWTRLL